MMEPMDIDEFAAFQIATGAKLKKIGNTWWRVVRPGFYRPLFLFSTISIQSNDIPKSLVPTGYQFPVVEKEKANSHINLLIIDNIREYSLQGLKRSRRKNIRKAQQTLEIRKIVAEEQLCDSLHDAYVSFQRRTGYTYRKDRVNKSSFKAWGKTLLQFPKVLVLGCYLDESLVGMDVSYLVENIVYAASVFYNNEAMKRGAAELFHHTIREYAAESPSAELIDLGTINIKEGINSYYLNRGAEIIALPSFYRLNLVQNFAAQLVFRKQFSRMLGSDLKQAKMIDTAEVSSEIK